MWEWIVSLGAWNWFILAVLLFLLKLLAPGIFMLLLGLAAILVGLISSFVALSWQLQLIAFAMLVTAAAAWVLISHELSRRKLSRTGLAPLMLVGPEEDIAVIATVAAAGVAGVAIVAMAPAVAATVAVGTAVVAGSVTAVKRLRKIAKRRREAHAHTVEWATLSKRETRVASSKIEQEEDWATVDDRSVKDIGLFLRKYPDAAAVDEAKGALLRLDRLERRKKAQQAQQGNKDDVECSVFAPARPERGRTILVQALLHQAEQLAAAVRIATEFDASANRKGFAKLSTNIRRGTLVQFFLEIPTLAVENTFREIRWLGEPVRVAYEVHVPSTARLGPCQGTLHMMIQGVPVGEVLFEINIGEQKIEPHVGLGIAAVAPMNSSYNDEDRRLDPVAIDTLHFRNAFVSYSRKDARDVFLYAEALEDCGIKLLVDITAIEPGEEFEPKLIDMINTADVFYLMWSKNAAQSEWVDKESRAAVARYDENSKRVPRIRPVVIEQPAPEPPSYLKRFHFQSKWLALRMSQKQALFSNTNRTETHQ